MILTIDINYLTALEIINKRSFYLKESSSVQILISPRSSLRQVMIGVGLPSAWQLKVTLIPSVAKVSALLASSTMLGGTEIFYNN